MFLEYSHEWFFFNDKVKTLILFLAKNPRIFMSTSDKYDISSHVQNHQKNFKVEFY